MALSKAADAIAAKEKAIIEKQRMHLEKATGLETVPFSRRGKSGFFSTLSQPVTSLAVRLERGLKEEKDTVYGG
jgi:hypothetical protein